MNLQDTFLNQVRQKKIPLTVYLMGGHSAKGLLKSFDKFCLLMDTDKGQNLVYKHAVASIVPAGEIHIFGDGESAK